MTEINEVEKKDVGRLIEFLSSSDLHFLILELMHDVLHIYSLQFPWPGPTTPSELWALKVSHRQCNNNNAYSTHISAGNILQVKISAICLMCTVRLHATKIA